MSGALSYNIILLLLFLLLLTQQSTQQVLCNNYNIEQDSTLLSQLLQSLSDLHPSNEGGVPPTSIDNFYYTCLARSNNTTIYSYSTLTVSYTNNIDTYYAQFVLECNANWQIITNPTTRMVLTGSELFLSANSLRENCYSCEVPSPASPYGCLSCPNYCPSASNTATGYCYITPDNNIQCCPYETMNHLCVSSCPTNFAPDSNFQCTLCTYNWMGPNCDVCNINCQHTSDTNCQFCECPPDFELVNATHCVHIDDCAVEPCLNGATCIDGVNSYTCDCINEDFHGDRCQNQHTPCVSYPCLNGGTCIDMIGEDQYMCYCANGFEGNICQFDTYDCPVGACLPGVCIDGFHNYTCVCPVDYRLVIRPPDRLCEEIDDCEINVCMNRGVCVDGNASFSCDCNNTGYTGSLCDVDINECSDNTNACMNGATCANTQGSYTCVCDPRYSGDYCERCEPGCINGTINNSNCTCECYLGYAGEICDVFTGLCAVDSCSNGGVCTNDSHVVECNCENTGYTGGRCDLDLDECQNTNICLNGGTCVNEVGSYSCQCTERYSGDTCQTCELTCDNGYFSNCTCICHLDFTGERCETSIDNCIDVFCFHGGRCVDQINDFLCDCIGTGYTGSLCQIDVNECFIGTPCQNSGTCHNTPGSYSCECRVGYHGTYCEQCTIDCNNGGTRDICRCICASGYEGQFCDDIIDNCQPNSCFNGGTCINELNNFTCQCSVGFHGNRCNLTFPDPCDSNPCLNNGSCSRITNTDYLCNCINNFTGVNCGVQGIACSINNCNSNQTCIDHSNYFSCECHDGYDRENRENECYDIDECILYPTICGNYPATCINSIGHPNYFNCSCPRGFDPSQSFQSNLNYCTEPNCQPIECVDIDECGYGLEICPPAMNCINTRGSFICVCDNNTFQSGDSCVSALQASEFDCQSEIDTSGNNWQSVNSDNTVINVCSNAPFSFAYRHCISPCECSTVRGEWSVPDLSNCISVSLIQIKADILSVRLSSLPNATHFNAIVNNFNGLAANRQIIGGDLSFSVVILFDILNVLEGWPSVSEFEITSLFLNNFLGIADYLLSKPETDWLEARNVTLSLLSLSATITLFTNHIALYLYQNTLSSFNYIGLSLQIDAIVWDEYQMIVSSYITHAPVLSVTKLLIPKINDPTVIGVVFPHTPLSCRVVFWKLYLPTFHTLLSADLKYQSTQPQPCVASYSQTTQSFKKMKSHYLSVGFSSPNCSVHSNFATPNELPIIYRQLYNTLSTNTFEIVYLPTVQAYSNMSVFPQAICNSTTLIIPDYIYFCISPIHPFAIMETTPIRTPYEVTALGIVFRILTILSILLVGSSLILILTTLITYIDGVLFVRINVIISVLITQLVFVVGIDRNEVQTLCTITSLLLHYLMLTSAIWSLIDIINCTLVIIMKWSRHKITYPIYCIIAYIVPLIYIAILGAASFCSFHRPREFCIISSGTDSAILWTVLTPLYLCVLTLLMATLIMIIALFVKREENLTFTEFEEYLKVAFSLMSSVLLPVFQLASWILAIYAFSVDYIATVLHICFIITSIMIGPYILIMYTLGSANEIHQLHGKRRQEKADEFRKYNMEISTLNPLFNEKLADWDIFELHSKQTDVSLSDTSSTTDSL